MFKLGFMKKLISLTELIFILLIVFSCSPVKKNNQKFLKILTITQSVCEGLVGIKFSAVKRKHYQNTVIIKILRPLTFISKLTQFISKI